MIREVCYNNNSNTSTTNKNEYQHGCDADRRPAGQFQGSLGLKSGTSREASGTSQGLDLYWDK